jgi:hypothetical protein
MDRAPDRLPTTTTGEPVATVPSGPIPTADTPADVEEAEQNEQGQGVRFAVPDPSEEEDEEEEGDEGDEGDEEGEDEEESDHGMDVDDAELHPASVRV